MSLHSSYPKTPDTRGRWLKLKARVPVVLISLGLILYYTLYLAAFVPSGDFEYYWLPDNVMVIHSVYDGSPAAEQLQADDVVLEIDGKPAIWTMWQPLFTPKQTAFEYKVQRDEQVFDFVAATAPPNLPIVRRRAVSGLVALFGWLVGSLVVLFAIPDNRDAWQLGITTILVSVVIAAAEAALYGVPGGWLGSNPLFPFIAIAWVQVSLLPRDEPPSQREQRIFATLYAIAAVVGLVALLELILLNPNRISIQSITGISSYETLLLCVIAGLLTHLFLLGWRYIRTPASYRKQQILIILLFAALAYLPPMLLTFLPSIFFDVSLLPWEVAIFLFALSPAGYAFVIYRRNYLGLDFFVTKTLALLILSMVLISGYSLVVYTVQRQVTAEAWGPVPGVLLLFVIVLGGPYTNRKIRRIIDTLVFGSEGDYQKNVARFASSLSAAPEVGKLREVLREVAELLQIRQVILMLSNSNGMLVATDQLRVEEELAPISVQEFGSIFTEDTLRSVRIKDFNRPIFNSHPWINYTVPLSTGSKAVGVLLLGRPVPDGYLNAEQVEFLCQVGNVMAIAVEAIRLFESSREMSRTLLEIRDSERKLLASQIHDEPLQRISILASRLLQLAKRNHSKEETTSELITHSQDLQVISRQLRDICAGLNPPVLQQGPQWAVREVVYSFRERTDLSIELVITLPDDLLVPENVTKAIYYLVTEALNNVNKHAEADSVWVSLGCEGNRIILIVEDNGRVASPAILSLSDLIRAGHFGVVGMHELASLVQGDLTISFRHGGGTVVTLSAPFKDHILN